MTADELLTRMLSFANSDECPLDRKKDVINGAYKQWADSLTNPFEYNLVKNEKIKYKNNKPDITKIENNYETNDIKKEFNSNIKSKRVYQVCKITNKVIKSYLSPIIASRELNINYDALIKCLNGSLKTAGGFNWQRIKIK